MRGFTLVELLVVTAILTLLAGLLLPVFERSRQEARIAVTAERLRPIRIAAAIYQADYSSGQEWDSLPPYTFVFANYLNLGVEAFRGKCGYRGIEPNALQLTVQYAFARDDAAIAYYRRFGGQSAVFTDASCNPSVGHWESAAYRKLRLMVTLDGNIVRIRRYELPYDLDWWTKP